MRKNFVLTTLLLVIAIGATACWNPEVSAVPLTAPWTSLNLPVKDNAIVWKSDPGEFRAVHKEDKKTVTRAYTEALKAQGWELGKFDQSGDRYMIALSKGGEKMEMEIYDFSNTGVVIYKK